MKVYLNEAEWWPVQELYDNEDDCWSDTVIDVPEELYKRYREVVRVFEDIQNEILEFK